MWSWPQSLSGWETLSFWAMLTAAFIGVLAVAATLVSRHAAYKASAIAQRESKERIAKSEEKVRESEARIAVAEQRARESDERIAAAELKIAEANQKAAEANEKTEQETTRKVKNRAKTSTPQSITNRVLD